MIDVTHASVPDQHPVEINASERELGLEDNKLIELSGEFIGRWSHLVSTTNWEKGRIICQWREALMGSECVPASYSDEAWSRRVGGVSAQHVGRLRRVYERFSQSHSSYTGLYWSHFLAALDWDDAELWLEGALQSGWSVSQMRTTRSESLGEDPAAENFAADTQTGTDDEDYVPLTEVHAEGTQQGEPGQIEQQSGPRYDEPDFGDDSTGEGDRLESSEDDLAPWEDSSTKSVPTESPFVNLPALPVDMAEALEQFKLAIIRHRADDWSEVSKEDTVKALEALKVFALQST